MEKLLILEPQLTSAHPVRLLSWRDGPKGPEHLVRFGQYRAGLRASPLYEEVWLTRAGMRARNFSRNILDRAKVKEEAGEGRLKREGPKKEEDEGIEVDVVEVGQPEALQKAKGENAEDAKDDKAAESAAENGDDAEDAHDAASRHSNEGQSPSRPAADHRIVDGGS